MKQVFYFFSHLDDGDVDWLAANGRSERLARGAKLIEQDAETDALFIVLEGTLAVSTKAAGEVARLEWGEVIGEMSLVDGRAASATVTGLSDSRVLRIERARLDEHLAADAHFAARFFKSTSMTISERLRRTMNSALDELNPMLLDHLHLAGARFDRLLKATLGAQHKPASF